jgi:hypothetical protein
LGIGLAITDDRGAFKAVNVPLRSHPNRAASRKKDAVMRQANMNNWGLT